MNVVPDQVALDVINYGEPVVPFCGWVYADDEEGLIRIYDDNTFDDWLEINKGDVIAQVNGIDRPQETQRSAIWVRQSASITRGQSGTALYFHDQSRARALGSDPAGGYGASGGSKRP